MFWVCGFEILHSGEKLPCGHFRAAPSHRSLIQDNRWTTEPEQASFWPLMLCRLKPSLILCSCHLFGKFEATVKSILKTFCEPWNLQHPPCSLSLSISLSLFLTHTCLEGVTNECKSRRGHRVVMLDYANVLVNDFAVSDNWLSSLPY